MFMLTMEQFSFIKNISVPYKDSNNNTLNYTMQNELTL